MRISVRLVFALMSLVSIGLLGAGLVLGEWASLHPCYLCNFQSLVYMVLAFFALCGAVLPMWRRGWSVLFGLTAAGGLATAIQQSWMQYAPEVSTACGFGEPTLLEQIINWLAVQWPSMFMVTGACSDKDWIFLGLSLANWSGVCFLGLLCVAIWQGVRQLPRQ